MLKGVAQLSDLTHKQNDVTHSYGPWRADARSHEPITHCCRKSTYCPILILQNTYVLSLNMYRTGVGFPLYYVVLSQINILPHAFLKRSRYSLCISWICIRGVLALSPTAVTSQHTAPYIPWKFEHTLFACLADV